MGHSQGKSADTTGATVISDTIQTEAAMSEMFVMEQARQLARVRCHGIFFEPPGLLRRALIGD
jgi:hypothetical protein